MNPSKNTFYEEEDFQSMETEDSIENSSDSTSVIGKWESINESILLYIFAFFDFPTLIRASEVCKKWNRLVWNSKKLDLSKVGPKVKDEVLPNIVSKVPRLESLSLLGAKITSAGLQFISSLTKLEKLILWGCEGVHDQAFKFISVLTNIVELDLCCCRRISDVGLSFFSSFQKLERLDLGSCIKVTDAGIRHLSALPLLSKLNLSRLEITDLGLNYLMTLPLRSLNLSYCETFTTTKLVQLTQLEDLSLVYCKQVNDAFVKTLTQTMGSIKKLDLWGCKSITDNALQLLATYSTLQFLDLTYCNVSDVAIKHLIQVSKVKIKTFHITRANT